MNKPYPLVSCLCLTRNRVSYLKRAVKCFLSQTYASKDLLVVIRDDDTASKEMMQSFQYDNIHVLEVPALPGKSLGELRNIAIGQCRGEYFCQWDDDDWYHNSRLQIQFDAMLANEKCASVLVKYLMYDAVHHQAYISAIGPWASSILCRKDLINDDIRYPHLSRREDSIFINRLYGVNCLFPVLAPSIYIYVYHGSNTWNSRHFRRLFSNSKKLSQAVSLLVKDILDEKLDHTQASHLLMQPSVLKEMDYFYFPAPSKREMFTGLCQGTVYLTRQLFTSFFRRPHI